MLSPASADGLAGVVIAVLGANVPAGAPFDAASLGPMINSLGLTPEQQMRLLDIASRHQKDLNNPRFLSEVESILDPVQREKVRQLVRQHAPRVAALPDAVSKSRAHGVFSTSFLAGIQDRRGNVLGGTEVVGLTAHQGKLYAATSVWKDNANRGPKRGAQILVLEQIGGRWKLDHEFDPSIRSIAAMESFSMAREESTTAGSGATEFLFVAPLGPTTKGNRLLYRKDHTAWQEVELARHSPLQAHALGFHEDQGTKESMVLVACQPGGIFRGVLTKQGDILWASEPELRGYSALPTSFARCNGILHVAIGPSLYRRQDGVSPSWSRVLVAPQGAKGNLRGLTSIPSPAGTGQALLAVQDGCGRILRIDPTEQYRVDTEATIAALLRERLGIRSRYVVAARHGMLPALHPTSADSLHIFGIEARVKSGGRQTFHGWEPGGWMVIRRGADDYELQEIVDPTLEKMPPLVSTRAMALSPFTSLVDPVLYCGGYNADSGPAHDSAWIFQASLTSLLPD